MKKFFKIFFMSSLIVFLVLFLIIALFLLIPTKTELNLKTLETKSDFTNFYDTHNELVITSSVDDFSEKISDIKPIVKYAFVAAEDKNFYSHKGLDFLRIIKAGLVNLKNGSFSQGASTISQQLIKNTQLSPDKTIKRKLEEIKLTQKLESMYTKDEIITMYLNTIYFGEGCYGIQNAANFYFDKDVNELNLNEITLLAASINSPSKINPVKNLPLAKKRQKTILSRMKECGYINDEEAEATSAAETVVYGKRNSKYDFYISCCLEEIKQMGLNAYEIKNCKIFTGLNKTYQDSIYENSLSFETDYQAIILDNKTLSVNAYYSTCGEIERMPASTIKPLCVYAPALDKNLITECTMINDEKTDFGGYSPSNFNDKYYGNITVKEALKLSLNVPSVKILNSLGIATAENYLEKMNLSTDINSLQLALGNTDKGYKLKNLAAGFTTFANFGEYNTPHFIDKIIDSDGKEIYTFQRSGKRIFKESTATVITDILKESSKSGTAKLLKDLPFEIATKTGTYGNKSGNSDAYSVSYTTDKTIASWLGNSDSSLMDNSVSGGGAATKNNYNILKEIYSSRSPEDFKIYGCEYLDIDKYLLNNNGEIKLASANTPLKYTVKYLFASDNKPKIQSDVFNFPTVKADIVLNDNKVKINIEKPGFYKIKVYKKDKTSKRLVYEGYEDLFTETIDYGEFEYSIIAEVIGKNKVVTSKEFTLPIVKLSSDKDNFKEPKPYNWWENDY